MKITITMRLSVIALLLMGSGSVMAAEVGGRGVPEPELATRLYTLPTNSSLYQLALQSGMTVAELRALNKGGIDRRESMKAGESLLLPATSPLLPVVDNTGLYVNNLPEMGMGNDPLPKADKDGRMPASAMEMKAAGMAQSVGSQDWNNMTGDQAQTQVESWAKNKAKAEVLNPVQQQAQDFLGKFGKAQVNITVDDEGSLKGSSGSLLTPWYDTDSMVIFSQVGIHGQDGRTIGNLGVGVRFDEGDWMWGGNTFLDQDISRNHTRGGVGGELWTDNLKFAANYYYPLSRWKDSKDFDDYLERPAKGFDVRAQGYLPSYPHLGASVVYEQYFGDEVALFGKDNLQSDPSAVTVGVDYTPVPLVTLKLSHKEGQSGKNEDKADLILSYQLGTPLSKQLDPDQVAVARSLRGSRYDMVDRNYDIVLEYKEKAGALEVDLAAVPMDLLEGDTYLMQPLVRSKYKVTAVNWNGDVIPLSITPTAGSTNTQGWQITLPVWDSAATATNRYRLSITLTNEKGKQVTSNEVDIVVGQQRQSRLDVEGAASKQASGLAADAIQLVTYITNHDGVVMNDPALVKPTWIVTNLDTGAVLTVNDICTNDTQNVPVPCVSVKSDRTEVRDGMTYYIREVVSTLVGRFSIVADLGRYGKTAPREMVFSQQSGLRAEILDPNGNDILVTQASPTVGVTYTLKLFNAANQDITSTFAPETLRWALDGNASAAGCDVTLTDHDTGVTGYTFTPRTHANSNSGVTCGDQGFGLKVMY
ncbi:inverse autotransporter beta domain-containing protein [Budvicia aquatica]|uniref:Inverse autotransporter beta-barrel domain-containing protein n=2 Tax=Budvicia aquatica TaxID=82979 RepID=A0A2C6DST1_9GAMM|nr:inverse autotransporter beta-barrel domain-containing protein [Budvicia aquatica]PHI31535.1 inverse autotransporter beta-barrel domain-containing protein [Budvicia aquatica]